LMKVATLWFERTVHSHLRTPKTSSGRMILMSFLILTWHDRRTPSRASPRFTCLVSVGNSAPPPSHTFTLHTPQEPLPPQADGMNTLLSASVPSSVPPARVRSALSGSSLTVMVTSPLLTKRAL